MTKEAQNTRSLSIGKISATALAVGTGLGASAIADAAIVYNDIADLSAASWGSYESFTVDLNSDGVDDFSFSHYFQPQGYCGYGCYIQHFGDSNATGTGTNGAMFGPLANGQSISGSDTFDTNSPLGSVYYYSDGGVWPGGTTAFLGLEFDIAGQNHYGWARLLVNDYDASITLFDFAYENVSGEGLLAGQTTGGSAVPIPGMAPLFTAALGAFGVSSFRRRKRQLLEKSATTAA